MYGRLHGHAQAFERLSELPQQLGEVITPQGRTRLFTLFRPTVALRKHFNVMVGALNAAPRDAMRAVLWRLLATHTRQVLAALLLGSLLMWPSLRSAAQGLGLPALAVAGVVAMGLSALTTALAAEAVLAGQALRAVLGVTFGVAAIAAGLWAGWPGLTWPVAIAYGLAMALTGALWLLPVLALVVWRFANTLLAGLHGNGHGLCRGHGDSDTPPDQPALTDWLTAYFNTLAGKPTDGPPLCFGELWGHHDPALPRDINLEVMTSAVSQQMANAILLRPGSPRFFYDPVEWERLFPPSVLRALEDSVRTHPQRDGSDSLPEGALVAGPQRQLLRPLPRRADLPVVVAVRMSLSFPVLLSAVLLYVIDWSLKTHAQCRKAVEAATTTQQRAAHPLQAKRIWFSDGASAATCRCTRSTHCCPSTTPSLST